MDLRISDKISDKMPEPTTDKKKKKPRNSLKLQG